MKLLSILMGFIGLIGVNIVEAGTLKVTLTKVVDTNVVCPGGKGDFKSLGAPLADQNKIVFFAECYQQEGVYFYDHSSKSIGMIVDSATPFGKEKKVFKSFDKDSVVVRPQDYLFIAKVESEGGKIEKKLYRLQQNKLTSFLNNPEDKGNFFLSFSTPNFIGKENEVLILASNKNFNAALYRRSDRSKPWQMLTSGFNLISDIAVSDDKLVWIATKKDWGSDMALYQLQNEKTKVLLDRQTEIPYGVGFFRSIHDVAIEEDTGNIAFVGEGILGQWGIYIFDGKNILKAVDQQTVIPDQAGRFDRFDHIDYHQGKIIFHAIDTRKKDGIYVFFVKNSEVFKIISGDDRVNNQVVISTAMSKQGMSSSNNRLAIWARLEKDLQALYLVQLDYIR